ncbi:hypothetical protein [Salibacterium aidingense]|uniref:hypothetical protein n=1 Tax=Salibacterium aidingense TaxID=384933 RepID=UPI000427DAD8|nr:hypothetical protein [Salibacterium aidingense]
MRAITTISMAAVLFLSGMMTGFHYSHEQWKDMQTSSYSVVENDQEESGDDSGGSQNGLTEDLMKRQDQIKEKGEMNVFSNIGNSLDFFDPSS